MARLSLFLARESFADEFHKLVIRRYPAVDGNVLGNVQLLQQNILIKRAHTGSNGCRRRSIRWRRIEIRIHKDFFLGQVDHQHVVAMVSLSV